MGVVAAIGSLAVGTASYLEGKDARQDARQSQEKVQSEQKAANAASAASERRKQVREERVRRARILQGSSASGTLESSGQLGAIGVLGTNLNDNLGANANSLAASARTSGYLQDTANAQGAAADASGLFNLSTSIFQMSGGFGTISDAAKSTSSKSNIPQGIFPE